MLKNISDAIYKEIDRADCAISKKQMSFDIMNDSDLYSQSFEDEYFALLEKEEKRLQDIQKIKKTLAILTPKQRKRYLLYAVKGLTVLEIAKIEGVSFQCIAASLKNVRRKIRKLQNDFENP